MSFSEKFLCSCASLNSEQISFSDREKKMNSILGRIVGWGVGLVSFGEVFNLRYEQIVQGNVTKTSTLLNLSRD